MTNANLRTECINPLFFLIEIKGSTTTQQFLTKPLLLSWPNTNSNTYGSMATRL
jgi:hypothetical protein